MRVLQQSGGGGPPEFLSSHPNPGNRLEYLTAAIQKRYGTAAQTGRLEEDRFRQVVGGRRSVSMRLHEPATWCAHCRGTVAAIAPAQ